MDPAALVGASLALHPAVRCVELEAPLRFAWPGPLQGDGNFLLVTRPHAEVLIRRVGAALASIVGRQAMPGQADELLETQPEPLLALIEAGAIQMEDRP
jgi:hypothetical protein